MKSAAKSLARAISRILTLPIALLFWVEAAVFPADAAFRGWSQAFSLIPGCIGIYIRRGFYQWVLPRCDNDVVICFGTIFSHPTIELGHKVYVGAFCCLGDVTLEDDVLIGSHVSIANGPKTHGIERLDVPIREQPGEWLRVTIGADTWIGDRATVLADVGSHSVIGAGSVVVSSVPPYAIAAGVPARLIRDRRQNRADEPSKQEDTGEASD